MRAIARWLAIFIGTLIEGMLIFGTSLSLPI